MLLLRAHPTRKWVKIQVGIFLLQIMKGKESLQVLQGAAWLFSEKKKKKSYLFVLYGCNVKIGQKKVVFVLLQFLAEVNNGCAGGTLHFKEVALPFLPCRAIIFNGNNNSLKPGRHFFCFIYRSLGRSVCCINAC